VLRPFGIARHGSDRRRRGPVSARARGRGVGPQGARRQGRKATGAPRSGSPGGRPVLPVLRSPPPEPPDRTQATCSARVPLPRLSAGRDLEAESADRESRAREAR
jgi:hypothetical protein